MASVTCPTKQRLQDFVLGKIPAAAFDQIARHVDECPACRTTLLALDESDDGFVARLRHIRSDDTQTRMVPHALIKAAQSAFQPNGGSSIDAAMDPGRRLAVALDEGPCRLGRFELLEVVGAGSFGYVFRAHDAELDRIVAVKVYRTSVLDTQEERRRFLREARSAAQLRHQNILALYETGESPDGACFLVTEYIEGETLASRLAHSRFEPNDGAQLIAAIADALHYAHDMGVVHRDIKPANLMLDRDGKPHIMDFGMAKRDIGDATMTREGDILGTPAYMSPEQARGEAHFVDARSDIFSLGAVLYEILTGDKPFQGNRRMLLRQVLEDDPRSPRRLNDRISRDLETVCLKALAKSPGRRYQTARAFADDIRRAVAGEPIHARPIGYTGRVWRWCRRHPVPAGLTVAIFIGLVSGMWHLSRLSGTLMEQSAVENAAMHAEMMDRLNTLYSDHVADPMRVAGMNVSHDFHCRDSAIPLPATFTIVLGESMRDSNYGMEVRLYSAYPFKSRRDGGPQDDFEKFALTTLSDNPTEPVYRFEEYEGRQSLRYATARLMQDSCIACHNHHPDSTKRDWEIGDVRGVLEIIHPIEHDVQRAKAGLRGTFVLVGLISGALMALAIGAAIVADWRRRQRFAAVGKS